MPTRPSPAGTTELFLDASWLARCIASDLGADGEIGIRSLVDPHTGRQWIAKRASWTSEHGRPRLQNELRLLPWLQPNWAAVPVAAIPGRDELVLLYYAEGARTIGQMLADGPLPVGRALDLAIGAARALAFSHAQGIVHGDIRPDHLLVRGDNVRLTGFGLAAALDGGHDAGAPSRHADLHALGLAVKAMLADDHPVASASPARPSATGAAALLPTLHGLIDRLIADDIDARYADALALLADLLRLRDAARADGPQPTSKPVSTALAGVVGSRELFGRHDEMRALDGALDRVAVQGDPELVLLAGAAGSGKSALADSLARRALARGVRSAAGKSEQRQRGIPFGPLAQALRSLTMMALGDDDATLAALREALTARLAGQGRAVAEIVPDIEHLIGRTAPLANVPAPQAQARVQAALMATLSVFATRDRPLVLFLDDLQWADTGTLAFLKAFPAQPPGNMLLLGAYRDHDPAFARQLDWLIHADRGDALRITRIPVEPLSLSATTAFVGAALGHMHGDVPGDVPAGVAAEAGALGRTIHRASGGNPFFAHHLLYTLMDEGLLSFDTAGASWHWNPADVERDGLALGVVELMVRRFARFSPPARQLVAYLACVGHRCEEALLARIAAMTPADVEWHLCPLVDAGLLRRENAIYVFVHDRILEAGYALTPPAQRPATHARIAALMIAHWQGQLAESSFEIANQIGRAGEAVRDSTERPAFVHALILAGRRARDAAAVDEAMRYADAAVRLQEPDWWSSHYALAYDAGLLRCECLLAQAAFATVSDEIDALLARHMPAIDKAAVYRLRATLQTLGSDYEGAISAALAGLALLGVTLRRKPTDVEQRDAYEAVIRRLGDRSIADLASLPAAEDRRVQAVMGLLGTLIASVFVDDGIRFLHLARMVQLTLEHGTTPESVHALAWYGAFIGALYDEYDDGVEYGLAALALSERHGYEAGRISALVAMDQVSPWTRPLAFALGHAQNAVALGRASGDLGMACYASNHIVSDLLFMGEPLALVEEEIERGLALTRIIQYLDIELLLRSQQDFVQRLRDGDGDGDGNGADGPWPTLYQPAPLTAQQRASRSNSDPTRFWVWLYDGMAAFFFHDYARAIVSLREAESRMWKMIAHINVADCRLYLALALAHAGTAAAARDAAIAAVSLQRDRFAQWSQINGPTFRNKLLLLEAELARLRGDTLQALRHYEASAHAAAEAGFIHEQALAHELAGMLCRQQGLPTAAREHLCAAHDGYRRWGAAGKARAIMATHAEIADTFATRAPRMEAVGGQSTDWRLGVQASQVISREVVLDRLVETLMTNLLVHAGAQYGLLLLMRGGTPVIEASARVVGDKVSVTLGSAAPTAEALPLAVLDSVVRSHQPLVLSDATVEAPSLQSGGTARPLRSLLCLPLIRGGALLGVCHLENHLAPAVFNADRVAALEVLAPQVAISLETARLYAQLVDENNRRAQAENHLRRAREELARTSHLTVLGILAASIGHEVNQPLTAIVTSVDASLRWLDRATPELGEVKAGLQHIRANGLRAAEIIRALRSLAREAPAVLAPVQIDDLVRDVLALTGMDIAARHVLLSTRFDAEAARVDADRMQLQQVLLNLITNALDAMTDMPPARRVLQVSTMADGDAVVVRVRDQGGGIAPELLTRIFDPFFTTKAQGIGMGLAICRSIVEAHGGTLEVQSGSAGSVFAFRLPAASGTDAMEATPPG